MANLKTWLVHILAATFGSSSWIAVNGVWVQTPLLVQKLPESWKLASYLVIIVQVANIGPFIHYLLTLKFSIKKLEKPSIHVILLIGCISCGLLSIFWDNISEFDGHNNSVAFMCLTAVLSLVDCTSSVLYLPFMAHFKAKYLVTHLIGQGLSGFLPSIFALMQGVGGNPECVKSSPGSNTTVPEYPEPRFSVSSFFVILLVLMILSWVAFILLIKLSFVKDELVNKETTVTPQGFKGSIKIAEDNLPNLRTRIPTRPSLISSAFWLPMIMQAYLSALSNGVLPSIQSYSCLPYGNLTYHLAVTLSCMANPLACSIAFFISQSKLKKGMPFCLIVGSVFSVYILYIGVDSPRPLLQHDALGQFLIVLSWVLSVFLFSFAKTAIASELRNTTNGEKALLYCGIFTQIGSFFGALLTFLLIQYTDIFASYHPCS